MKSLNLYGTKSGDKFIPTIYKTSSVNDRLELLAGLIDTDGSLSNKTSFDYITKSEALANDIAFICRSLGLSAYPEKCTKTIKSLNFSGEYYRMCISGNTNIIPVRLPRKIPNERKMNKDVSNIGFTINQTDNVESFLDLKVEDDKFLLSDFTVIG